jgi:hypothetical protein
VRLLAVHPEDLRAGLLEDLPLLLDRRGVDPVLGVEDSPAAGLLGRQHPLDARQRRVERDLLVELVAVEVGRAVAEVAGQRLLADDELAALQRRHGDRLVRDRRRADVDHVHGIDQGLEAVELANAAPLGIRGGHVRVDREDADDLDVRAVDLPERLEMKRSGEPRPDDARANRLLFHRSSPLLYFSFAGMIPPPAREIEGGIGAACRSPGGGSRRSVHELHELHEFQKEQPLLVTFVQFVDESLPARVVGYRPAAVAFSTARRRARRVTVSG